MIYKTYPIRSRVPEFLGPHTWLIKALWQKLLSTPAMLPTYHWMQRKWSKRLKSFHARDRLEYAIKIYKDVSTRINFQDATIMEIGTGWVPVVPLALSILGAKTVYTYDLNRHLQPGLTMRAVAQLKECLEELSTATGVPLATLQERHELLEHHTTWEGVLTWAGVYYEAPGDAANTRLLDGQIDLVYSNLVLEHIPEKVLQAIHKETRRVLRPGGVAWHNIDYSDHYSNGHPGRSLMNMLRYSKWFWDLIGNNEILYQNRLRARTHQALFEEAGLKNTRPPKHYSSSAVSADLLGGMQLHPFFDSRDDLEITASVFMLERA